MATSRSVSKLSEPVHVTSCEATQSKAKNETGLTGMNCFQWEFRRFPLVLHHDQNQTFKGHGGQYCMTFIGTTSVATD